MKAIYVDDEFWMIKRFRMECQKVSGIDLVATFEDPREAISYAQTHEINCAFLDITMPRMSGLELSDHLKKILPDIIIIYISAYDEFMPDAFKHKGADYYILKPYTSEEISAVCERARLLSARQKKRIFIETFGNFSVYIDGLFLNFSSKAAKELLALMVNKRGTALTNKEAFFLMWEDLPYTHENMTRIRKGIQKLRSTLSAADISEILISSRGEHRLNTDLFDCDYYDFLDRKPAALSKYNGEYMLEYSWAEETNALLNELQDKNRGQMQS